MSHGFEVMLRRLAIELVVFIALLPGAGSTQELGDIQFQRRGIATEDVAAAVFPHWVHRMQYTCYACHDAVFKMKAGANPITMEEIGEGKWCGVCHDGKTAFAASSFSTCTRCHRTNE